MPPDADTDMLPSAAPLHCTSCTFVAVAVNAVGSFMVSVAMTEQELPSVTVTLIAPCEKLLAVLDPETSPAVFSPLLHK